MSHHVGTYGPQLHRYHRILDLPTFRNMVANGVIPADEIASLTSDNKEFVTGRLATEDDVKEYFKDYLGSKVFTWELCGSAGLSIYSYFFRWVVVS